MHTHCIQRFQHGEKLQGFALRIDFATVIAHSPEDVVVQVYFDGQKIATVRYIVF